MRGNSHVRCEVGENLEITSKDYLSLYRYLMHHRYASVRPDRIYKENVSEKNLILKQMRPKEIKRSLPVDFR